MNNNQENTRALKTMVRSSYDLQKLRIEMGNRLVATFKAKLGATPGKKEEEALDAEDIAVLKEIKNRWRLLTKGVIRELPAKRAWSGDGVITTYTEACLVAEYLALEKSEASQFRRFDAILEEFPVYTQFLAGVRGCGPAMSAVIISEIDITRAQYPSSLWKYAGLDVVGNAGRSRKREHLREIDYINKDGAEAKRLGITFNPLLKTKLIGVLGPCLIKSGSQPYREIYDGYKHRLESHPDWAARSKGHRHNAAIRYMVKRFLADLYTAWRGLAGLPVAPEYAEAKLGVIHHPRAA
jgi:hypothetical protein